MPLHREDHVGLRSFVVSPAPPPVPQSTVTAPAPSGALATYPGAYFSIDYPANWYVDAAEARVSYGFDTTIRDPSSPTRYVRVDYTPNAGVSGVDEAANVQRTNHSRVAGYREIDYRPISIAGYRAIRWEFEEPQSGELVHKVDVFLVDSRGTGIAILTQAPSSSYESWRSTFERVYRSFRLRRP
jgi:hypothetical protein